MSSNDRVLYLNKRNRKFLGVCAGLADYLRVDAWAVRLAFVLGLVIGPWFVGPFSFFIWLLVPLYFILWLCLDVDPEADNSWWSRRSEEEAAQPPKRMALYRNKKRGKLLGVCAGTADYFGVGTFPIRLITVVAFFMSGTLVGVGYLGAYFLLDDPPEGDRGAGPKHYSGQPVAPASSQDGRSGNHLAKVNVQDCERKLRALQGRLAEMEAYTTSRHYKLHREFKDLS